MSTLPGVLADPEGARANKPAAYRKGVVWGRSYRGISPWSKLFGLGLIFLCSIFDQF